MSSIKNSRATLLGELTCSSDWVTTYNNRDIVFLAPKTKEYFDNLIEICISCNISYTTFQDTITIEDKDYQRIFGVNAIPF